MTGESGRRRRRRRLENDEVKRRKGVDQKMENPEPRRTQRTQPNSRHSEIQLRVQSCQRSFPRCQTVQRRNARLDSTSGERISRTASARATTPGKHAVLIEPNYRVTPK